MVDAEKVRQKMRISHELLDEEITDNIFAARAELTRAGVAEEIDDELTDKAIELYCKAEFDYEGKGEQYKKNFNELRDALSVSGKYKGGSEHV